MEPVEGARSFAVAGDAYDRFMGRYSRQLAPAMAEFSGIRAGQTVLDVGCGPGALTAELVARVGAEHVQAVDPSPTFVADCTLRNPGVDVRQGRAEELPIDDATVDAVTAQLVLHFVSDPARVAAEFLRVLRPGGTAAACVWDFDEGMQMLRVFWDAALELDPDAPDEARVLRFGREGEIAELFREGGFVAVAETTLRVTTTYAVFDELWHSLESGIGPAGSYLVALPAEQREKLRTVLYRRLGAPEGAFELKAMARAASGRKPR